MIPPCPASRSLGPLFILALSLALALVSMGASCQRPIEFEPEEGFGVGGNEDSPVEPEARERLDEAAKLAADGRHVEARKLYRGVAAEFDVAAGEASVMAAAMECEAGQVDAALPALLALGRDEGQSVAVRRGALGYHALCAAGAGRREVAMKALEDYPGQKPSPLWLEADRVEALMLLAEARRRSGDPVAALGALSWAYEMSDVEGRALIRAWGLDLLRQGARLDALEGALGSEDDLTRGLAGAALLLGELASTSPTLSVDRMQEILALIAPSLVRLDEGELAGELSRRLSDAAGPKPVIFGALLPMTGRDRRVGAAALEGILMAQGSLRPDAMPRSTLIIEDTRSTPEGARQGVEALAERGVLLILGPLDNAEAREAAEAAQRLEVPLIALSVDAAVVQKGPWIFRRFLDSRREVEALMRSAARGGKRRVAVLAPDLAFGRDLTQAAEEIARREGVEVVFKASYDPEAADFSALALQLRRARADAVFIPDSARRVARLMPFLAAEDLWCSKKGAGDQRELLCMGGATWLQPELLSFGGDYVEGALIAASYAAIAENEANVEFRKAHQLQIGGQPDLFAAFAYDAARMARELVLSRRLTDRVGLREALSALQGYEGITGPVAADATGDLGGPPAMIQVRDRAFVNAAGAAP